MGIGSVAGAFVAGVLTVLSPCVLPILPIVLSAAASERKYGPAALAAGLAISFVAIGLFVATIGYSVGLTTELFRQIAAALMILLGAVWSPCVGPTLGAASLLAAQGRQLPQVALSMFVFGLGAALPLLGIGLASREAVHLWRTRIFAAVQIMKMGFGVLLIVFGTLVLTGINKRVETALVNASPHWLTDLTTRF